MMSTIYLKQRRAEKKLSKGEKAPEEKHNIKIANRVTNVTTITRQTLLQ